MDLFSIFKSGKYFDKHIDPKCDYCRFGKRAKDGNKVLCEKRGLVDCNYSCSKFIYSPLTPTGTCSVRFSPSSVILVFTGWISTLTVVATPLLYTPSG